MRILVISAAILLAILGVASAQERPMAAAPQIDLDAEIIKAQVRMLEDQINYLSLYVRKQDAEKKATADWWKSYIAGSSKQ